MPVCLLRRATALLVLAFPLFSQRRDVIVVTGTYEPIPLEEADRAVKVFELQHLPITTSSLIEWLRFDPSVDLRQRAPGGVQVDVSIRGGTFGQTLVLLDGFRINDPQTGHHNLNLPLPLESVSQVEILRGTGSTLYGSDAVGGVINIIPAPLESYEVRVQAAAGSFGTQRQALSVGLASQRWSQRLSGSRDFSTGFMPNRDYRNFSLGSTTRLSTPLGPASFIAGHSDRLFGAQDFYGPYPSWERTRVWFGGLRQQIGGRTALSLAHRRHTDLFVLYRYRPELFANRHATGVTHLALRTSQPLSLNSRLHVGVEGLRDAITSSNLGSHRRYSAAGYFATDFRALGRLSLSAGLRYQFYEPGYSTLSPSVSAGLWLRGRAKVKGSLSRGFRVPSYTDLYYHDPANRGSPDLRPEKALSYEVGLEWHPGGRWRTEAMVFQRRETDGIDYVRTSPSDLWRATNIQRLRFTGFEFSVSGPVHRSHAISGAVTLLRGARASLGPLLSRYVFNYPTWSTVAAWHGPLPAGFYGHVRLNALQRLARQPYLLIDAYLSRPSSRLRPFFNVSNLTSTDYQEIPGVRMPGRSVFAGLEFRLTR